MPMDRFRATTAPCLPPTNTPSMPAWPTHWPPSASIALPPCVRLSAVVKNAENREAGLFLVAFYLSSDPLATTTDLYLGAAAVLLLGPGAEKTVSVDATIPAGLPSGTYSVGAVADALSQVVESDEGSNALAGNLVALGSGN